MAAIDTNIPLRPARPARAGAAPRRARPLPEAGRAGAAGWWLLPGAALGAGIWIGFFGLILNVAGAI